MSDLFVTLITGSVTATFFTALFNRINSEKSAIHNESEWRNDLYYLSKQVNITREDLELFRTCLSASRGINNNILDKRTAKRFLEMDDICIFYYHYLVDDDNNFTKHIYEKNENYNFDKKFGKLSQRNIDNDYDYISSPKKSTIFRQLCRLLLKSDWEHRDSKNNILNRLSCVTKYNEIDRKAVGLLYSLDDIDIYKDKDEDKYKSLRKAKEDYEDKNKCLQKYVLFNNKDESEKDYFDRIANGNKLMSIDISKMILMISCITFIILTLFRFYLITSYFNKFELASDLDFVEKKFLFIPLLISIFYYLIILVLYFVIHLLSKKKNNKKKERKTWISKFSTRFCIHLFLFLIVYLILILKFYCWYSSLLITILSIIFLYFINNFAAKTFGFYDINLSYDLIDFDK
ncbi:hypothetical protein DY037_07135 [Apilactobacillus micheneri]|uniref:MFS transporter n=1 Tax=Apilactobacillus micheneri TaxID=1899430 RepID=UPI0011291155|nr:MFS transporter [Apilactobacillus micheneri]TPR48158.1 hypothetical protein DY037_07135 [Apilactobacillus micheneri]